MSYLLFLPLNILQVIFMWAWTALNVSVAMLIGVVARRPHVALRMAYRPWAPVALAILLIRMRVTVDAAHDWKVSRVYVSNHQSMADVPALFGSLRTPLRVLAKKELFDRPVTGWYLKSMGMIPIDRGNRKQATERLMQFSTDELEGSSILAFPEGTRSRDGGINRFKKGAFILAMQEGLAIVPVAVEGTRHVVRRSGVTGRPARVSVRIGEPIETTGLGMEDLPDLIERVQGEVIRMHGLALEELA
jgi:1-acyl-sn-glycerol-3-phosphate acyltransferase